MASEEEGSARDAPERGSGTDLGIPPVRGLLQARVPLWLLLAVLVVVGVGVAATMFLRDTPELGPAIDGARNVEVEVLLCNETVDQKGINPRTAELDLEQGLRDLGARAASVAVQRRDCGRATQE